MKHTYHWLLLTLFLLPVLVGAQSGTTFWQTSSEPTVEMSKRLIVPNAYASFQLEESQWVNHLTQAPMEFTAMARNQSHIVEIPMPDGSMQEFRIVESPIMAPGLAAKYPELKTWSGQGIDDPSASIRMDHTPKGFHGMILSPHGTVFIDPYSSASTSHYISYYKRDFSSDKFTQTRCGLTVDEANALPATTARQTGEELRTYRLAMATTGEYTAFHGGTVASALAAIVTTMNRVNGVYEMEVAVRMELVANTDQLIYTNAGSDPYTNNNGLTMLGQNQANVDNIIGSANYDIGHVFSTGGGGIAGFGVVCNNGSKGRGVTGLPAPVGDPFDIDYVAHEIGHQFGGSHTFNGTVGSCAGGNRAPASAYEPGSGSTIMAYAGICGGHNIQNNSDAYFHGRSFDQITTYTQNGTGNNCAVVTNTGNLPPVIDSVNASNFFIPIETPFVLTGSATDPDGDALTYCWEQFNLGPGGAPNSPSGSAPIFRSFNPVDTNARTFPNIQAVISNNTPFSERYPTYSRNLTFRMTVRDNRAGGGGVSHETVNFEATEQAGPFEVTFPNTFQTWTAGLYQEITWDVANTDLPPVNCSHVHIYLSRDGGFTITDTLAMNVPNTGSHLVLVPDLPGNQNRIRIQAADNIFFDLSNSNFQINLPTQAGFNIFAQQDEFTACVNSDLDISFLTSSLLGFSENIGVSLTGVPAGVTFAFDQDSVAPGDPIQGSFMVSDSAAIGTYFMGLVGNTASGPTDNVVITLNIIDGAPPTLATLSFPPDGTAGIVSSTSFSWPDLMEASSYGIQVATSPDFAAGSIVAEQDGITGNAFALTGLDDFTVYYWRVRAANLCGSGPYSSLFAFQTGVCQSLTSTDVPVTIPAFGNPAVATSAINMMLAGSATDVRVLDLKGTHEMVSELTVKLISPNATEITLFSNICDDGFSQNFDLGFADGGLDTFACSPVDGATYQPEDAFSAFDGENVQGPWTLRIEDEANFNSGELQSWALQLCQEGFAAPELITNEPLTVNRFFRGGIGQNLLEATSSGAGATGITFTLVSKPIRGRVELDLASMSIGTTFTQNDINNGRISYLHFGDTIPSDAFTFDVRNAAGGWIGVFTYQINVNVTTGLSTLPVESVELFPNPTQGQLRLNLDLPGTQGIAEVRILNLHGQLLQQHQLELQAGRIEQDFTIADYPAGVYLVDIQTPAGRRLERVVLAH
ncbi:MAG: reprolysin-like metallopeptidase [Bacteroidota bacterium]